MNKDRLTSILYRIIQGRTSITIGGSVFWIEEPSSSLVSESYEYFDKVYEEAYLNGVYVEEEITDLLIEMDIWTPHNDRGLEDIKKEIENKKVEAFENFFKVRELVGIKRQLKLLNEKQSELLSTKHSFDFLSCSYIAEAYRLNWLISKTIQPYHEDINLSAIIGSYREKIIPLETIRDIARLDVWRSMWAISKDRDRLFNKPSTEYTRDQISLCSFSQMYDNVYENPEAPDDKVIQDNDCLDGWFIVQRRKRDKSRKEQTSNNLLSNEKIRNAKEVFIVTNNQEEIKDIESLNDGVSRKIKVNRDKKIESNGSVKDTDFDDVKTELEMQKANNFVNTMKGK